MRQEYDDTRLAYQKVINATTPEMITMVHEDEVDLIWQPDTFIRNERWVIFHDAMSPNRYLRLYPNGHIQTSQRLTWHLSCPRLKTQLEQKNEANCHMDIASCKYI